MKAGTQCRYSVNIYSAKLDEETFIYEGELMEKSSGQRVHRTEYFREEQDCIDACYDWIDEQKEMK